MIELVPCMLLQDMTTDVVNVIRIIHVDDAYVHYIALKPLYIMPCSVRRDKFQELLENKFLERIYEDPLQKVIPAEKLSEKEISVRNDRYVIVQYVWEDNRGKFLQKSERMKLFLEVAGKCNVKPLQVRRLISLFLQGGMTLDALTPGFRLIGNPGKQKSDSGKKRGRHRKNSYKGEESQGINIKADDKQKIRKALVKHYLSAQKQSWVYAYRLMLRDSYSDKYYADGEIMFKTWSRDRVPSYNQFFYWAQILLEGRKT